MNRKQKKKSLIEILNKTSILCLTAYTVPIAKVADKYADIILVGDSLGPVLYGLDSTREVNLDMMIRHATAVVKNTSSSLIVVDMPFGSYEKSKTEALKNAKKIISATGANAVKLEGGEKQFETIKYLTENHIKVMGHLGMLPQSTVGKPKVYGTKESEKNQIFKDIDLLEKAGVFSVVIECTIKSLVDNLIKHTKLPLIGIGASSCCKGQIIVTEDILGMTEFNSKFAKKYFDFFKSSEKSLKKFSDDVRNKKYPNKKQCY